MLSNPPLSNHSNSWYVCFTKPRQEALAKRKLEEQGYEVFLPMLTQWERKKEGWARKQQVMFPRYAFLRCGRPGQSIGPVRSTPGMSGLVTFGMIPATLDESILEAIRALVERQDAAAVGHGGGEVVKRGGLRAKAVQQDERLGIRVPPLAVVEAQPVQRNIFV